MRFDPYIETQREIHQQRVWIECEVARHYVRCRRKFATINQVLDVWLRGPQCAACYASGVSSSNGVPQISAESWIEDVSIELGQHVVDEVNDALALEEDFAWSCIRCHGALRPWAGDDVYIATMHLEEDHSLATDTGPKRVPSDAMRKRVLQLYEYSCFGCGAEAPTVTLTIDHIIPKSRGGDAAFRNLQPLCELCQQIKRDIEGEVITVHDNLYFREAPGDSYEGLFW